MYKCDVVLCLVVVVAVVRTVLLLLLQMIRIPLLLSCVLARLLDLGMLHDDDSGVERKRLDISCNNSR